MAWFIIATVRIDQGTTQELYGPYEHDSDADEASAWLAEQPRVVRQIICEPMQINEEPPAELTTMVGQRMYCPQCYMGYEVVKVIYASQRAVDPTETYKLSCGHIVM